MAKPKKMDSLMVEDVFPDLCFPVFVLFPNAFAIRKINRMIKPSTMFDRPLQSWTSQQASLALQPVTPGRLGCR